MNFSAHTSMAVMYARAAGIALTIAGVWGMFVNADQDTVQQLLRVDVNLTHNVLFLVTGVLGLFAGFAVLAWARSYALVIGLVYTVLGFWGLFEGSLFDPFGAFTNINMAGSTLHLVLGVIGLVAFAASMEPARETSI